MKRAFAAYRRGWTTYAESHQSCAPGDISPSGLIHCRIYIDIIGTIKISTRHVGVLVKVTNSFQARRTLIPLSLQSFSILFRKYGLAENPPLRNMHCAGASLIKSH